MPLGLVSSEVVDDYWSQNSRRKVFYSYPNGTAPLTGLVSLMDTEDTPQPQFGWWEDRWVQLQTVTKAGGTANTVFYGTGTTVTSGATVTITAGTTYRIYITDASKFQADDVIKIHNLPLASGTIEAGFRVVSTDLTASLNFVEAVAVTTTAAVTNNASSIVGLPVIYSGSAFAEGSRSRTGRYSFPIEITNYTQIQKTAFEMTANALKEPTKYDKSGDYKNQLKKNGIDHLSGIEWTALTGDRRATTAVNDDTGVTVRRSFTGGLLWFLKQWELGNISNGGAFDYRPGGTDVSTQTDFIAYPQKRIIRRAGAVMSKDSFEAMEALAFQKVNSNEWCKLCLCGPGYLAKVNSRYSKEVQKTELRGDEFKGFTFMMHQRTGLNGDIYYKQHPLFSDPASPYFNSAFYIDLGYIKWRPVTDRDTDIMQMIQLPDADLRKDQWLTDGGYEWPYPEAHLFVDNLGTISL